MSSGAGKHKSQTTLTLATTGVSALAALSYQLPAKASIVFVDTPLTLFDGEGWDVDGGGNDFQASTTLFSIYATGYGVTYTYRVAFGALSGSGTNSGLIGGGIFRYYSSGTTASSFTTSLVAKALPSGYLVSAGRVFNQTSNGLGGAFGILSGGIPYSGIFAGAALDDAPDPYLIGFRFLNDTTGVVNFGWAEVELNNFSEISITRYAYDDMGNPIAVADTGAAVEAVPEPNSTAGLALLAMGAGGLRSWRRRKQLHSETDGEAA